jgi:hypothetical protein
MIAIPKKHDFQVIINDKRVGISIGGMKKEINVVQVLFLVSLIRK